MEDSGTVNLSIANVVRSPTRNAFGETFLVYVSSTGEIRDLSRGNTKQL